MKLYRVVEIVIFVLFGVLVLGGSTSLLTNGWSVWLASIIGGLAGAMAAILACKAGDCSEAERKEYGIDYC